jgi:hypothetical protein
MIDSSYTLCFAENSRMHRTFEQFQTLSYQNMINKINKERRRSMNATPIGSSNKNQWQGAQADPKQNQGRAKTEHGQVNH